MPRVKVRLITDGDIPAAINLLDRGFGKERASGSARPRSFWENIFSLLRDRSLPAGELPRYGYVIQSDDELVGIMLLIYSTIWKKGEAKIRCGGSAVYVDPAFSFYAPLLLKKASNCKEITVLNLTPAEHTFRMIEALGYVRYCNGIFVSLPLFSRVPKGPPVRIIDVHAQIDFLFDSHDRDLLLEHANYGCMSLWCITSERAYPFVFRMRKVKNLPCAQLVYCRDMDDFVRFARPIGGFLARHAGQFLVLLDANGPIKGLIGRYFAGKGVRYFAGKDQPELGDLAYTEISLFGV